MPTLTTNYSFNKPLVNNATDSDLWGGYLNDNMDAIDTEIKTVADSVVPPSSLAAGIIMCYGGTSAPSGYLFCYGQAVSRATYSDLFTAISTTFGSGDGSTTFNLPDIRGRVVAGKDDMGGTSANRLTNITGSLDGDTLGNAGGAETVTLSTAQVPPLSVDVPQANNISVSDCPGFTGGTTLNGFIETLSTTGGGGAHPNVQPTFILNYIIKT